MAMEIIDTDGSLLTDYSLEVAELVAAAKMLEVARGPTAGRIPHDLLEEYLVRFVRAYEIVKATTEEGVEEARELLKKK